MRSSGQCAGDSGQIPRSQKRDLGHPHALVSVGDFAPCAGGAGKRGQGKVDLGAGQNYEIDAAIFSAALGRIVAGDGMKLGVAGCGETLGRDGLEVEEEPGDAGGAGRGELPVGVEFTGVDGDVVRVSLDA